MPGFSEFSQRKKEQVGLGPPRESPRFSHREGANGGRGPFQKITLFHKNVRRPESLSGDSFSPFWQELRSSKEVFGRDWMAGPHTHLVSFGLGPPRRVSLAWLPRIANGGRGPFHKSTSARTCGGRKDTLVWLLLRRKLFLERNFRSGGWRDRICSLCLFLWFVGYMTTVKKTTLVSPPMESSFEINCLISDFIAMVGGTPISTVCAHLQSITS